MDTEHQLITLLQNVREDGGDEAARAELNELLRNQPEARSIMAKLLVDEQAMVSHLRDDRIVSILDAEGESAASSHSPKRSGLRLLAWPQQIAAGLVAGALVGLAGVGVVWAVSSPKSEARVLPVANGDFEEAVGPTKIGFPSTFGTWSGNPAEIVEEANGNRILRFLRTGNVMGNPDGGATNCSVFQLVDLTSLRHQWGLDQSESQLALELSARFRREAAPTDPDLPRLEASIRIYLFQGEPEFLSTNWPNVLRDAEALGKQSIRLNPGDESATISTTCAVNSEVTLALIAVAANAKIGRTTPIELGGYFVDDVQLTAIRQPNLPVRFVP